jgi:hypothetical protein
LVTRARKAATRWFSNSRAKANARRDEALRWVGKDLLSEPIPEKLLKAFRSKRRDAEPKSTRRRDSDC